jgi:hypothetical protein
VACCWAGVLNKGVEALTVCQCGSVGLGAACKPHGCFAKSCGCGGLDSCCCCAEGPSNRWPRTSGISAEPRLALVMSYPGQAFCCVVHCLIERSREQGNALVAPLLLLSGVFPLGMG